jgi:hypothetical protein
VNIQNEYLFPVLLRSIINRSQDFGCRPASWLINEAVNLSLGGLRVKLIKMLKEQRSIVYPLNGAQIRLLLELEERKDGHYITAKIYGDCKLTVEEQQAVDALKKILEERGFAA